MDPGRPDAGATPWALPRGRYLVGGGIRIESPTRSRVPGYWGFQR